MNAADKKHLAKLDKILYLINKFLNKYEETREEHHEKDRPCTEYRS